jgi:hypothetical protein
VRLLCLGRSLVTVLTSTDLLGAVLWRLLRFPRLSLSRRVWFTNRFTEAVLDLPGEHLIRRSMQHVQPVRRNPYPQLMVHQVSRICA